MPTDTIHNQACAYAQRKVDTQPMGLSLGKADLFDAFQTGAEAQQDADIAIVEGLHKEARAAEVARLVTFEEAMQEVTEALRAQKDPA